MPENEEIVGWLRSTDTQQQDAGARALVDRYLPRLVGYLQKAFGMSSDEASDVIGPVLENAVRRIEQLREPGKLGGWLFRSARNRALSNARKGAKRLKGAEPGRLSRVLGLDEPPQGADRTTLERWKHLQLCLLNEAHARLVKRDQEIWNTIVENHSNAVVAELFGITLLNARQRRFQVIRRMRREIKRIQEGMTGSNNKEPG